VKKALAVLAMIVLLASASTLAYVSVPKPFEPQARAATGAIFVGAERRFNCSGTEIGHTATGDGVFLTARHCVADPDTNAIEKDLKVSFSDNEGGPFFDAMPIAISSTDDVALMLIRNGAGVPEVRIKDERKLKSGDPIFNVSFPFGTGRQAFYGHYMRPNFPVLPAEIVQMYPFWLYAMPMDVTIAPGSSGSGVFSGKERALIGIAVGSFQSGSYEIATPADRVLDFLNDLKDNTVEKFIAANPEREATVSFF